MLIIVGVIAGYVVNRWWIVGVIAAAMSADSMITHNGGFHLVLTAVMGGALSALGVYSRRRPSMFRRHAKTVVERANKENIAELVKEQRDLAVAKVAPPEVREAVRKTTSETVAKVAPPAVREAVRKTAGDAYAKATSPELREAIGRGAQNAIEKAKSQETRDAIERGKQQAINIVKSPETQSAIERGAGQAANAIPNPMVRTLIKRGQQELSARRAAAASNSAPAAPTANPNRPDPRDAF